MADWQKYRDKPEEKERVNELFGLIDQRGEMALDIGAHEGFMSRMLTERFSHVVALDILKPQIEHPAISPIQGDICHLPFADNSFDFVLCAEVLEHINPNILPKACAEIRRVVKGNVVIGVPYKQDIRVGRTTCQSCGKVNPPWGHQNSFDETKLKDLMVGFSWGKATYVGTNRSSTNFLSAFLLDLAGNPYGTYDQDGPCVYCGAKMKWPPPRSLFQKLLTRLAAIIRKVQSPFVTTRPEWIHVRFRKQA